mgnify:CR=1 FL=1
MIMVMKRKAGRGGEAFMKGFAARVKVLVAAAVAAALIYLLWLPYVPRLKTENPARTAIMERRTRQAAEKGKKFQPQMFWMSKAKMSRYLVNAVMLAEDDTFYQHHGFDFDQIRIAVQINWKKKKFAYGGSTITQQLARTLYLSPSKNLLRKLKEAIITVWMEMTLSKSRILEIYLNVVEWGDGIFGAEAAAQHYYQKSATELTPEESVALASILPSPRKWSPLRETKFMKYRRSNILSRMELPQVVPALSTETQKIEEGLADELEDKPD